MISFRLHADSTGARIVRGGALEPQGHNRGRDLFDPDPLRAVCAANRATKPL